MAKRLPCRISPTDRFRRGAMPRRLGDDEIWYFERWAATGRNDWNPQGMTGDYPVVNGGSDKGSVWGIHIPYIFHIHWGAVRSYLEFPNHLLGDDLGWWKHSWQEQHGHLVGGDWNMNFIFPYIGKFILSIDELIFVRGVGSTTNQWMVETLLTRTTWAEVVRLE